MSDTRAAGAPDTGAGGTKSRATTRGCTPAEEAVGGERMTYVYAIGGDTDAPARTAQHLPGVDGGRLRVVGAAGLAALVSSVPADAFDEDGLQRQLEDLPRLESVARTHHLVVDAAFAESTVLPLRLATVYRDDSRVTAMLHERRAELLELLQQLDGHVELGVKVYADPVAAAPVPAAVSGADASPGRAYLRRRRAERDSSRDAQRSAADLATRAAEVATALARARVVHRPQQGELATARGRNISNEAYLVPATEAEHFRAEVMALTNGAGGTGRDGASDGAGAADGVRVEVTGPWAPYSFATVAVAEPGGAHSPDDEAQTAPTADDGEGGVP